MCWAPRLSTAASALSTALQVTPPSLRVRHTTLLTVLHLRCELLDLYCGLKEIIAPMYSSAGLLQYAFGIRFGCWERKTKMIWSKFQVWQVFDKNLYIKTQNRCILMRCHELKLVLMLLACVHVLYVDSRLLIWW